MLPNILKYFIFCGYPYHNSKGVERVPFLTCTWFKDYIEVHEAEPTKELEQYKSFIYLYDGMPNEEDATNQIANQQQVSITAKSQTMSVKLHLGTKLHSRTELHSGTKLNSRNELHLGVEL